jgi:hypothetical protein
MRRQMMAVLSKDDVNSERITTLDVVCKEIVNGNMYPHFLSGFECYNDILVTSIEMPTSNADEYIRCYNNAKKIVDIEELHGDTHALYSVPAEVIARKYGDQLENLELLDSVTYLNGETYFVITSMPEVEWEVLD